MLFCLLLGLCFPLGAAFPPCGPDGGCENGQMEDMNLLSLHKGNVVKVNKSGWMLSWEVERGMVL